MSLPIQAQSSLRDRFGRPLSHLVCFFVIAGSFASFVLNGLFKGPNVDFSIFYAAGRLWNEGRNAYNLVTYRRALTSLVGQNVPQNNSGYYYPPQTSALFSLFAHLTLGRAYELAVIANLLLLIIYILLLAFILSRHRPIGLAEITLLVSFINTGFGRVTVRDGLLSLLISVCLVIVFVLEHYYGRRILAGTFLSATTIKPSFTPLFVVFYLVKRSYRIVATVILAAGLLTVVPLLLTHRPLLGTMMSWAGALQTVSKPGTTNDPSPFQPYSALLLNLTPLVYRVLNAQSPVTTVIAWLVILLLCLFVIRVISTNHPSKSSSLLDFAIISALSLVVVYHRSYDAFLLLPGLICLYLYATEATSKARQRMWIGFIALALLSLTLPGDLAVRVSRAWPFLLHVYMWRVLAPFQTWTSLAILGALLWLKTHQSEMDGPPITPAPGIRPRHSVPS